jgi:hypothetical protein
MFIAKGLCGRLFFLVGQQNRRILCYIIVATLALGSQPRQKGLQGCGPKGSLGVTSKTPGSARECEGVSLHIPRATPTLGEGVPVDSQNFREPFEGSKLNSLWRSLYHWKALRCLKWARIAHLNI